MRIRIQANIIYVGTGTLSLEIKNKHPKFNQEEQSTKYLPVLQSHSPEFTEK